MGIFIDDVPCFCHPTHLVSPVMRVLPSSPLRIFQIFHSSLWQTTVRHHLQTFHLKHIFFQFLIKCFQQNVDNNGRVWSIAIIKFKLRLKLSRFVKNKFLTDVYCNFLIFTFTPSRYEKQKVIDMFLRIQPITTLNLLSSFHDHHKSVGSDKIN